MDDNCADHEMSGMRVLYITSVCDPDHTISASAFTWANALGARCEQVDIIALDTGGLPLPNVRLHSLHRSQRRSRWEVVPDMLKYLWQLMPQVDVVFCQYSTSFVFAAAPLAKLLRKPIVFWWSHGHVDVRLHVAIALSKIVVTSAKDSLRVRTPKKRITGHGIDTTQFTVPKDDPPQVDRMRFLSLGRISPVKECEVIIQAAARMREQGVNNFVIDFVGEAKGSRDENYLKRLWALVSELSLEEHVRFLPPVPHSQAHYCMWESDVFVNALAEGGLGRAWLEAMSCGLPTVLCTDAFDEHLGSEPSNCLRFRRGDDGDLADKLTRLASMSHSNRRAIGLGLREIVASHYSIGAFIDRLYAELKSVISP